MSKNKKEKTEMAKETTNSDPFVEANIETKPAEKMQLRGLDMADFAPEEEDLKILTRRRPTVIPTDKPSDQQWWQIHPEIEYYCNTLKWKEDRKNYIVMRQALGACAGYVRPVKYYLGIYTSGSIFLFPIPVDSSDDTSSLGRSWHESAERAVIEGRNGWVKIIADKKIQGYQIYKPEGQLRDPEWPSMTKQEIFDLAFREQVIQNEDHPIVKSLRGQQVL